MAEEADERLGLEPGDFTIRGDTVFWHERDPATLERHGRWETLVRNYQTYPECLWGWSRVVALGVPE